MSVRSRTHDVMHGVLFAILLVMFGCGGEEGQSNDDDPAEVANAAPNAATEYRRIYSVISPDLYDQITQQGIDAHPGDWVVEALEGYQPIIEELVAATKIEHCDFEIEDKGSETLLPHLPDSRDLAKVLGADAARHARAGRSDMAADRIVAIMRLADHVAHGEPARSHRQSHRDFVVRVERRGNGDACCRESPGSSEPCASASGGAVD